MDLVRLEAKDYDKDKSLIEEKANSDKWFVLDNDEITLDQYLSYLFDQYDLKNKYLARLKVCRNIAWQPDAVSVSFLGETPFQPENMLELLEKFPDHSEKDAHDTGPLANIIIENDKRSLLANIAQQFIFLGYPLDRIDLRLHKDVRDAESVDLLMKNIVPLESASNEAINNIAQIRIPDNQGNTNDMKECRKTALENYEKIRKLLAKAHELEMKVAVAASKKTGKSVIVNCLLGQELAPTSLEMATPNSCIYRKSPDNKYRLLWDRESDIYKANPERFQDGVFDTPDQIYRTVNRAFKEAQKDQANKFLIPDMIIEYASNGNNFESYTIHDTPGPDAAGTDHKISAQKAIQECDASIFAIDYSKYLTEDEEKYLAEVKEIFAEKQKFHTLLFDLNKMDLALQDNGAKSRVKSIDFIRNRLMSLDPKYEDCIIFATAAQDYFHTISLKQAAKSWPELEPLLAPDADWKNEIEEAMTSLEESDEEVSDALNTAISTLEADTTRLKRLLGYDRINLQNFREFTGVPQLMGYLAYILKSKAREEIINSIAVNIDTLSGSIKNIISKAANLLTAMDWNASQISRIKEILDEYSRKVRNILDGRLTENDKTIIPQHGYINTLFKGSDSPQFEAILTLAGERFTNLAAPEKIMEELWNQYEAAQIAHLMELKDKGVIRPDRLGLPENKFHNLIMLWVEHFRIDLSGLEENYLICLKDELKTILENRFQKVRAVGAECRQNLEKEDCNLILPEVPSFAVDFPEPLLPDIILNIAEMNNNIKREFASIDIWNRLGENWKRHGWKFWEYEDLSGMVNLAGNSREDFKRVVRNQYREFYEVLKKSEIIPAIMQMASEVGKNSHALQEKLLEEFKNLTDSSLSAVDEFAKLVDDRGYYEQKTSELKEFLEIIDKMRVLIE